MVQQILPGLYQIEVPLPRNPLKALNCYVIVGGERNLIIDTGFDQEECWMALNAGLQELAIDLAKTDLFITHLHADHSGMIHRLATPTCQVYASEFDAKAINIFSQDGPYWEEMREYVRKSGFPTAELTTTIEKHPGFKFRMKSPQNFTYVYEGDKIQVADYSFTCLSTPGHTQGHMCLYEERKKILVSGDHILGKITPNISLFSDKYNPLQLYLDSLDKVAQLEVEVTLPGHRHILGDCRPRIAALKAHHEDRLTETLAIVVKGSFNAYEIAAQMTWDMTYKNWADFPIPQKWFALGEAIAHLKYLVEKGTIRQFTKGAKIYYST